MTSVIPPTHNTPHVISALNAAEMLLTFGHTRLQLTNVEQGETKSESMVEWLFTVSMSPTAVVTLRTMLDNLLMRYRELYGPITEDKATIQRVLEITGRPEADISAQTQ